MSQPATSIELNRCIFGHALKVLRTLPDGVFDCCVSSPPYWGLRDYGHDEQIGLEPTPEAYVAELVSVFREVRRVLRDDGSLWLNLGDSYAASPGGGQGMNGAFLDRSASRIGAREQRIDKSRVIGLKPKDLVGIPWMVAFALRADGWWLRSEIIWAKPNPMPESVTDRPTKAHEQVFLLAKSDRYYFDAAVLREPASKTSHGGNPIEGGAKQTALGQQVGGRMGIPAGDDGRNARTVWALSSEPYKGAHFATMPPKLARRCILAGSREGGAVLDPFFGSGTTGMVAEGLGRRWLGIELNSKYEPLIRERTKQVGLYFDEALPSPAPARPEPEQVEIEVGT